MVETPGAPNASIALRLISDYTRSFERFATQIDRRQPATLVISNLQIGSVIAQLVGVLKDAKDVFDLAEAAGKLYDAKHLLAAFVASIGDIVATVRQGQIVEQFSAPMRDFLRGGAQAIERGAVTQIVISVTGDNNQVIIDPEAAKMLIQALGASTGSRQSRSGRMELLEAATSDGSAPLLPPASEDIAYQPKRTGKLMGWKRNVEVSILDLTRALLGGTRGKYTAIVDDVSVPIYASRVATGADDIGSAILGLPLFADGTLVGFELVRYDELRA